ncbi:hypothetical protein NBRC10513v2_001936 [Rhodotorula toruloides]|uniref:DUF7918 domain-containing protein n=1 Tax=Rhodotorula toruloides TaxID=5286 RepID=A0A2T0A7P3_RHOTO|nr:hypothetical protein AAT19DRAFT_15618 [Rhodotorula toruloides]
MHLPDSEHRLEFPGLPGVYGWICVDNEPLEVYDATDHESRTVAYVESKDDVKFTVHFLDTRTKAPEDSFVVLVDVDGTEANGTVFGVAGDVWDGDLNDSFSGFDSHNASPDIKIRPFLFRKLVTTDQAQKACNDRDFINNLGTVQLKICRIKKIPNALLGFTLEVPEGRVVDERKKKARLTHQVAFGENAFQQWERRYDYDHIDKRKSPFSSLCFRYRSKVLLQVEGHAPDPEADKKAEGERERHSPSPTLSADTDNSLPPQVARRQLADKRAELEMLELEKRIAKVKREILVLEDDVGEEVEEPKRKRVKVEEGVKNESEASGDGKGKEKEKAKGGKKVTVIDLD